MSHVNKAVAGSGGGPVSGVLTKVFSAGFATLLGLVLTLGVFTSETVQAERATPQEMERVCQNWLTYMVSEKGAWAGETDPRITGVDEIIENDTVLARCFSIAPQGHVVVPVLKELPPIKAYSDRCGLDVNQAHGIPQLLKEVLLDRARVFVRTYGSLDATQPSQGDILLGRVHSQQWDRFAVDRNEFESKLNRGVFSPMDQVGPLLTVSWHQHAPYNNYCPWGDGGRCVVGCVATAAAQITAYHRWPEAGYGSSTYYWSGDQSCGGSSPGQWLSADFSDEYDWANIPDHCHSGCSPEEEEALAELNYEVGVAFKMDYGRCGSAISISQIPACMNAFETYFRYHDQMVQEQRVSYTSGNWFNLIKTEINADRPIWYFITSHSIVCDGWQDPGGLKQYHMNYGWDNFRTTWYTLDQYYCPDDDGCYQEHEFMVRNIAPDKGVWLTADPTFGWVPFDVSFTGTSEYTVLGWMWDFGDGDSAFVQSPLHTYQTPDMFDITLAVDTGGGDTFSLKRSDYVIVLADSMIAFDAVGDEGETVEMIVYATNTVPLNKIMIPFEILGTLNVTHGYEDFSTAGCRTEYFEIQTYQHWGSKQYTIRLETSSTDMPPGNGEILKLYFDIPWSASLGEADTIEIDGYTAGVNEYLPLFSGSIAEYQAEPVSGIISLPGCCNHDGIRGDVNYDVKLNVSDLTYLVNYLFKGGPAPPCFEEGDITADEKINVSDLTCLVSYLFQGGQCIEPCY